MTQSLLNRLLQVKTMLRRIAEYNQFYKQLFLAPCIAAFALHSCLIDRLALLGLTRQMQRIQILSLKTLLRIGMASCSII